MIKLHLEYVKFYRHYLNIKSNEKLKSLKKIVTKEKNVVKKESPEEWFKIIDAGVDVSNFGDPSEWQRETRKSINNFY